MMNNMKQKHKQSSITNQRKDEETMPTHHQIPFPSPKSLKQTPPFLIKTLSRSINYIFKEQRLIFILIGILIGLIFFIYQPSLSLSLSTVSISDTTKYNALNKLPSMRGMSLSGHHRPKITGRVPVGLGRRRMRVVVTGGSGFVGSHLVDRLIERGDEVIVIDNFFTGRKENVVHHIEKSRFELIRHDVVEPILLEVDQIYHLACPASPVHYKYNPVKTIISLFSYFQLIIFF